MSGPSGLAAISGRIQVLSAPPPAVAAIHSRFAGMLDAASAAAAVAEPPAPAPATSPHDRLATIPPLGETASAVPSTFVPLAAGTTSTAPVTTTPVTTSGTASILPPPAVPPGVNPTAPVTGVWASRVPNARGQALVPAIAATAQRYGLDPAFLAAVFWTESSYTADAVSPTGAIGLGQLMPGTAETLGVDPWDPMQNMDGAARLYRYYLEKYDGDIELAISAYAAGPGAVARAGGIPDDFTANYIVKLLGRRDWLNGLRETAP